MRAPLNDSKRWKVAILALIAARLCGAFDVSHGRRSGMVGTAFSNTKTTTRQLFSPSALQMTALDPASFLSPSVIFYTDYLQSLYANTQFAVPAALGLFVTATIAATAAPSRLVNPSLLESVLKGTFLNRPQQQSKIPVVQCVYKASRDGWSALAFHEAVDGLGSALVVARSLGGKTFGGYNPNGFRSTDDYYTSSSAFLWCLASNNKVVKLPVLAGGNCAVFDYATAGPCFGAADLLIGPPRAAILGGFAGPDAEDLSSSAGTLRQCRSSVGSTYDFHPAWPVRGATRLVDVEVYAIPNNNKNSRRK